MRAYYYVFYKLNRFWELVSMSKFLNNFKSVISIAAVEMWLVGSLINYYRIFKDNELTFSMSFYIGIALFFAALNYFLFIHTDKWKKYDEEFGQLPRYKNIIGGIIVWIVIILIIVAFFTSAYLIQKNILGL